MHTTNTTSSTSDFEELARECGATFFLLKSVNNEELINMIKSEQHPCSHQRELAVYDTEEVS